MMIPGSQARLWIGQPVTDNTTSMNITLMRVFRFRTINIRPRAPRIDVTNSEGLPGGVRGNLWDAPGANGIAQSGQVWNPFVVANQRLPFTGFKNYPTESQLPGIGVCDVEVEQASWDFQQIVYSVPNGVIPIEIIPQRYISCVIAPNWQRLNTPELWVFPNIYIEEAPHRINVKQDQPVTFTGYTNGPWRYPQNIIDGGLQFKNFPAGNSIT